MNENLLEKSFTSNKIRKIDFPELSCFMKDNEECFTDIFSVAYTAKLT